jgi:hypothetical protein
MWLAPQTANLIRDGAKAKLLVTESQCRLKWSLGASHHWWSSLMESIFILISVVNISMKWRENMTPEYYNLLTFSFHIHRPVVMHKL